MNYYFARDSIAAIPAESIPFVGVAVLIADTGYDLYEACQTIKDLDELYSELGVVEDLPDESVHAVCNPNLPDPSQVWADVMGSIDQWRESLLEAL
jgi:hypothetical protein